MTLEELRDYLWADTDEQQATLLQAVLTRLEHLQKEISEKKQERTCTTTSNWR